MRQGRILNKESPPLAFNTLHFMSRARQDSRVGRIGRDSHSSTTIGDIVILYLAAHFTFSADYRHFKTAAKLVFKARKRDHVQALIQALHWLPVQARIDDKMSTVCHNFFFDSSPASLYDLLAVYTPSRQFFLPHTYG